MSSKGRKTPFKLSGSTPPSKLRDSDANVRQKYLEVNDNDIRVTVKNG